MAAGSVGAGLLMQCKPEKKDQAPAAAKDLNYDRTAEEVAREKELMAEKIL